MWRCQAPEELVDVLRVSGAYGRQASKVNGIYGPPTSLHNGKPAYPKVEKGKKFNKTPSTWLRYDSGGRWMISSSKSKDENSTSGWMYSEEKGVGRPDETTDWNILDEGRWVQQVWATRRPAVRHHLSDLTSRPLSKLTYSHFAFALPFFPPLTATSSSLP